MGTALTLPWGGAGGMAEAATGAFFFSFFFFLFGHPTAHGIPRPGISSEPQLQPTPDPYPPVPGQESNLRPSECSRDTADPLLHRGNSSWGFFPSV